MRTPGTSGAPGSSAPGSEGREAGYTLVEMTITLLLVAVGMGLAIGLVVESQRMATQAALTIRAPHPDGPLAFLESELRSATAFGSGGRASGSSSGPGAWSRDRLVVVREDGTAVAYERDGRRLVRRVGGSDAGRTVVPELRSWRWAALGPNLVTVEVVFEPGLRPTGGVVTPRGRRLAERTPPITRRFVVAVRGAGGNRGW